MFDVEIKIIDKELYADDGLTDTLPKYHSAGACAIDLRASETRSLAAGECYNMKAGLAIFTGDFSGPQMSHPSRTAVAALIIPRGGLGTKGLVVGNLVGLIDEDYQGEIQMALWNRSDKMILVERFDRVAQMMFTLALKPDFRVVEEFSRSTERGEGRHGSTGTK